MFHTVYFPIWPQLWLSFSLTMAAPKFVPKKNVIPYDIFDEVGNVKHAVLRTMDNTSERERIHSNSKYLDAEVPDTDIHIVCPRCVHDFGVALCSKTVLHNRELIRKNKAGTGPHDSYVDHVKERKCAVNVAAKGKDVSFDDLLASCTLPQRKQRADGRATTGRGGGSKKKAVSHSLLAGDFRYPYITKDTVSALIRCPREKRGPFQAVLVRWYENRDMDTAFWLHRFLEPIIRIVYFDASINRVILYSHQRIIFRTFDDKEVLWSEDNSSTWNVIDMANETRGTKSLKNNILATLGPLIHSTLRIFMTQIGKRDKEQTKKMYERRSEFYDFVREQITKHIESATPTQIFDMFVETSQAVLNTFKTHNAPLFVDAAQSDAEDSGDLFALSESESTIMRTQEPHTAAPAVEAVDKPYADSPLGIMRDILPVYTALSAVPDTEPDMPDNLRDRATPSIREQFQEGIDTFYTKCKDFMEEHDNAFPDLQSFRDMMDSDTLSVWDALLPTIHTWLSACITPPSSQQPAKSDTKKGGRPKRGRSVERTADSRPVTRQKLNAITE